MDAVYSSLWVEFNSPCKASFFEFFSERSTTFWKFLFVLTRHIFEPTLVLNREVLGEISELRNIKVMYIDSNGISHEVVMEMSLKDFASIQQCMREFAEIGLIRSEKHLTTRGL